VAESKVIAAALPRPAPVNDPGSMGALLIDAGRLKIEDAEKILKLQREKDMRFGEAGLALGLVTQADIDYALSHQFDYPYIHTESAISEEVIAAYRPMAPQVEALRALRSQLVIRWFDADPAKKALAIVSAEHNEGRSFIAANLAVVFAQLGQRTLLIDADLRHPSQHRLFGLDNRVGLSALLAKRVGPEVIQRVPAPFSLSVLTAGATPPNPLELHARGTIAELLHQLEHQFDVILLDTPAAAHSADAQIIAVRTGAALIVARKNSARSWHVQGVSDTVVQAKATLVGAVLNNF